MTLNHNATGQKLILTTVYLAKDGLCHHEKKLKFAGLYQNNEFIEIQCEPLDAKSIVGNIYIGRVSKIDKNLEAAFIQIGTDATCYLPLSDFKACIFTHKKGKDRLNAGDELLVQVVRDAIKTKAPLVSTNLNLTGSYAVLTTANCNIGISSKINGEQRKELKEAVSAWTDREYGWIIRTNAANVPTEQLFAEMKQLTIRYETSIKTAVHKTLYTCIYQNQNYALDMIRRQDRFALSEIVTDDRQLYEQLSIYYQADSSQLSKLRLYEDESYSLTKLYSIETTLIRATSRTVRMKSGAYLVIEPTEALTVIDVNSGKYQAKKRKEDYFLKVNLESAKEIAKQLRLRNISGICIVDFIDMDKEQEMQLMAEFKKYLKEDPIPTRLVDFTTLHLAEITRKKTAPSLYQQIYGA